MIDPDNPLKPVINESGVMTTATQNTSPKPIVMPPQAIKAQKPVEPPSDPYAGLATFEPEPTTPIKPVLEKDPYAGLATFDETVPAPIVPQVAQPPATQPGFIGRSMAAAGVGITGYAANKLRGISTIPYVPDESLLKAADWIDSLVDPETVQMVNNLTGGQLQITDAWGIIKQLPTIGWYGFLQNTPQLFDAIIANKVGGTIFGALGALAGPKGLVVGKLIGGPAMGTASAGLTEAGSFKGAVMPALRAQGIDEKTANMLADKYARMYGPAAGVIEYSSNMFQVGRATKGMRKSAIDTLRKTPIWKLLLDPLTGGLSEGGEELSQGWLHRQAENLMWAEAEKITGRKLERPEQEDLRKQGITGFAVGVMMGAMGLPVNIASRSAQNRQAAALKKQDFAAYQATLRDNLVSKMGLPAELVDQSGLINRLSAATSDEEYNKILKDFADQNLAPQASASVQADQVQQPEPVVLPPITAEELSQKPPETGLPPLQEVKTEGELSSTPPEEIEAKSPIQPPFTAPITPEEQDLVPPPAPTSEKAAIAAGPRATAQPEAEAGALPSEAAKPEAKAVTPELSYDQFKQQYMEAFKNSNKYNLNQVGFQTFTDKMAELADKYPEHLNKLEAEEDAKISAKPAESAKGDAKSPTEGVPNAITQRVEPVSRVEKYQGIDEGRVEAETGREDSAEEGGIKQSEVNPVAGKTPDIQQVGRTTTIYGTRNESFPSTYAVVPRSSLIASHDPLTFSKNPLYPLENPRDYSTPEEQGKVISIRNKFQPDQHITDSTSSAIGPVMAAHIIDENGKRGLVVLGGNNREMVMQSLSEEKQKELAEYTNERASQYKLKELPDASHELIRYMGEYDLRKDGVREEVQRILDSLNPSLGKAQTISQMARNDAKSNLTLDDLADITNEITAETAQNKVKQLLKDNRIDSHTRSSIGENPASSQEYIRRAMVNMAFDSQTLADFSSESDRKRAAGRGLIEAFVPTGIELRRKKQGDIADAFALTLSEVVDYIKQGKTLQDALKLATQQQQLDLKDANRSLVQDIASLMRDRIEFNKKGSINTDETINIFMSLGERFLGAVKQWLDQPDLFNTTTMAETIKAIVNRIKTEQAQEKAFANKEITISSKIVRESRRQRPLATQPDLIPEGNIEFSLLGDRAVTPEMIAAEEARKAREAEVAKKAKLEEQAQELPFMPPPVNADRAKAKIDQFTANWKNKPKGGIKVVQSEDEAATLDLSDDSLRAIHNSKAEGFYHIPTDTVVIIADNLQRPIDAVRVAIHETVVHSGLRGLFGSKFETELEKIGKDIPEADLTEIALGYELDMSKRDDRLEAYEEYLGKRAETRNPALWDQFVMAVKRALRAMGIDENIVDLFDRRGDIDRIIDAGREYVEGGRRAEPVAYDRGEGAVGIRMSASHDPEGTAKSKETDISRFYQRTQARLREKSSIEDMAIVKKNATYKIAHHEASDELTVEAFKEHGPDELERMLFQNGLEELPPATRPRVAKCLIELHWEMADKTKNIKEQYQHKDAAVEIYKLATTRGTELGQEIEAYKELLDGVVSAPGGAEFVYNKRVKEVVKAKVESLPVTVAELTSEAQEAKTEAINEVMVSERVQKELDKILERLGATAWKSIGKDWKAKAQAFAAQPENAKYMKMNVRFAATLSLEEKMMVAVVVGNDFLASSRELNFGDWSAKMTERFGAGIAPHLRRVWNEIGIALNAQKKKSAPIVGKKGQTKAKSKQKPASLTDDIKQSIQEWLSEPMAKPTIGEPTQIYLDPKLEGKIQQPTLPIQKTILDNLEELGLTRKEAFVFMSELQRDAFKKEQAKQESRLKKLLRGKPISQVDASIAKRLMEISSIKPLSDESITKALSDKLGMPELTDTQLARLEELAEKVRKAPEGSPKSEAMRALLGNIEDQLPIVKADVFWSMWYANMLSGYQTQERNILSTTANVLSNLGISMAVDPKNAPFALMGFISGIKKGWREAKYTLQTGEMPVHIVAQSKMEAPMILERSPFKGFYKVLNNWKYVLRLMVAEDAIAFKPAQEQRAMMVAADVARAEGLSGRMLWERVAELVGRDAAQIAEFEEQAKSEGFTGYRLQRRVDELSEMARPEAITKSSIDYAKRGTFNYRPEGVAGIIGQKIREITRNYPLGRAIVPFTQIVANVTNTSLDYSPWGFVRAVKGMRQIGGKRRAIVGHERASLMAKAVVGSTAMIAAYALDRLNGGDDDDKTGWFGVFGKGSGDSNKDNQMRERGWRPWSIKLGKHYFDYRLTPLAIPLGVIGSVRDAERWRKLDEKDIYIRLGFAALRSLSVITDMSFMSGITQLMGLLDQNNVEGSARKLNSFIARSTVGAVVPNFFKQLDRTFDPTLRDSSGFLEACLREIPIASRLAGPRLNVLGEPVKQRVGPVSLVLGKEIGTDPVWNLIVKNEAWISVPDKAQYIYGGRRERKMTENEYYDFIKYRGEFLREKIERNLSRMEGRSKARINEDIDRYTLQARDKAKSRIRKENAEKGINQ